MRRRSELNDRVRPKGVGLNRAMDVLVSATALTLLSPLMLVIAIAIWAGDGCPIFYLQRRLGRAGHPFHILKFRSMYARSMGPMITAGQDPRVTPVGRWLRKFKLDELPQFLNVLRGEMSLIGPRPEVPQYVNDADPIWSEVLRLRPGITDLASLIYRDEEKLLGAAADADTFYRYEVLPSKLLLNQEYQHRRTLRSDIKLLWMTARYGFLPQGFDPHRVAAAFGIPCPDVFALDPITLRSER